MSLTTFTIEVRVSHAADLEADRRLESVLDEGRVQEVLADGELYVESIIVTGEKSHEPSEG